MRIKKVKLEKEDRIFISYEKFKGDTVTDEVTINTLDKPLGSFLDALQALSADVIEMCELPDSDKNRTMVKGVSFSYSGEKPVMGATITAQKHLAHSLSPLIINTPHKIDEFYGESGDDRQLLSDKCVGRLDDLITEAKRFIEGERAQGGLFNNQEAASAARN